MALCIIPIPAIKASVRNLAILQVANFQLLLTFANFVFQLTDTFSVGFERRYSNGDLGKKLRLNMKYLRRTCVV